MKGKDSMHSKICILWVSQLVKWGKGASPGGELWKSGGMMVAVYTYCIYVCPLSLWASFFPAPYSLVHIGHHWFSTLNWTDVWLRKKRVICRCPGAPKHLSHSESQHCFLACFPCSRVLCCVLHLVLDPMPTSAGLAQALPTPRIPQRDFMACLQHPAPALELSISARTL